MFSSIHFNPYERLSLIYADTATARRPGGRKGEKENFDSGYSDYLDT